MSDVLQGFLKLEKEANDFGFSWPDVDMVFEQVRSEVTEVEEALAHNDRVHLAEEMGDLIHAALSLCYTLGLDPEQIMEQSTKKFQRRFDALKAAAQAAGYETLKGEPKAVLMRFWQEAKTKAK